MDRSHQKTGQQLLNKASKPIIPIFSVPSHRVQSLNVQKNQDNAEHELQKYKRNYMHLLQENQLLQAHLAKVIREKDELEKKFHSIHINPQSERQETQQKKKRQRRVASQIARDYCCPSDRCGKSYGTDASLVQHIKIKHSQFFNSPEYQEFINSLRHGKNTEKTEKQQDRIPLNSVCLQFNR